MIASITVLYSSVHCNGNYEKPYFNHLIDTKKKQENAFNVFDTSDIC